MHKNHTLETFVAIWSKQTVLCIASIVSGSSRPPLGGSLPKSICRPTTPVVWWPKTASGLEGCERSYGDCRTNKVRRYCEDVYRIQVLCLSEAMPVKGSNAKIHSVLLDACPSCGLLAAIPIKVVYIHALLPLKQPLMTPPTFCGRRRAFVEETKKLLGQDH